MRHTRILLTLFMLIALLGIGVTSAQAHAMLMSSIPAENATLTTSPAQVELFFSEAIDPNLSNTSVMDSSNKRVDSRDSHLDPADATHMIVSLPSLSDGVYTVMWKAVSATDGHQTTGSYPFAIGNVAPNAMVVAQQMTTNSSLPAGIITTKVLLYLASAAIIGGMLFAFLVWNPSIRQAQITQDDVPAYVQFSRKLLLGALLIFATADVLSLFAQAGQVNGTLIGWPWQSTFKTVLLDTRFGAIAIARLCLAFILAGLLLPRPNRWNRWIALAVFPLILLSFSLESHAASEPLPILPVLADWIHFAAISVWVGGLISFLGGIWAIRQLAPDLRTRLTSYLIPHFTMLALTSAGLMALTGAYSAYLRIGTPVALLDTTYGKVLLIKLLIIAPMLGMGGFHFLVTTPLMRRAAQKPGGSPELVRLFRRLLTGELVLGIFVLIIVGIFTTLPPVRAVATTGGYTKTTTADDLRIRLNINPGRAGNNTFTATITSNGKPVTDAQDVSLEFDPISGMMPASKAAMVNAGNGMYTLSGGYLGMPDQWDIKVVVMRAGKFDAYADYKVPVNQAVSNLVSWRPVTLSLIGAAFLCCIFFILLSRRNPAREWNWA